MTSSAPVAHDDPLIGALRGGRYRLLRRLGEGGMGVVYEAEHLDLGRRVAVKMLRPELSARPEAVARLAREARINAALGRGDIVDVLDLVHDGADLLLVMELLTGETLDDRLRREGRLPVTAAVALARALCEPLAAAHAAGVVHRDVKPANVFLVQREVARVKLLDFGAARVLDDPASPRTRTGVLVGTPHYMAPEQASAERDVDARADVWAVGALLYECLTGSVPFEGRSVGEVLMKIACVEPPPLGPRCPEAPPALVDVVLGALRKDRDARPPSVSALRDALAAALDAPAAPPVARAPTTPSRHRMSAMLIGALAASALSWGALSLRPRRRDDPTRTTRTRPSAPAPTGARAVVTDAEGTGADAADAAAPDAPPTRAGARRAAPRPTRPAARPTAPRPPRHDHDAIPDSDPELLLREGSTTAPGQ